jgi:hypothetical protein
VLDGSRRRNADRDADDRQHRPLRAPPRGPGNQRSEKDPEALHGRDLYR